MKKMNDITFWKWGDVVYKLLEAQFLFSGLSKKEVAAALGIGYNTLLAKLRGKSDFTLDEAVALKQILHASESVEELFSSTA